MQSVSSRIWTRVAVSNSYDDNDYTTGTSYYGCITWSSEEQGQWKPLKEVGISESIVSSSLESK